MEEPDCAVPDLDAVARTLELVDVTKLNSTEMVGFLCITLAYKHNFPERDAFIARAKSRMRDEGRSSEDIDKLLKGLE